MNKTDSQKGSFMVEAIVAVTLAMVGLLGILNLIIHSLGSNTDVVNRFIAANLGAEGVEVVKNIIDTNYAKKLPWNSGINPGVYELSYNCPSLDNQADHCVLIGDLGQNPQVLLDQRASPLNFHDGLYDYQAAGTATVFKRIVMIDNLSIDFDGDGFPASDEIKVNVLTTWSEKGHNFTVNLEDHFFNWRQASQENGAVNN